LKRRGKSHSETDEFKRNGIFQRTLTAKRQRGYSLDFLIKTGIPTIAAPTVNPKTKIIQNPAVSGFDAILSLKVSSEEKDKRQTTTRLQIRITLPSILFCKAILSLLKKLYFAPAGCQLFLCPPVNALNTKRSFGLSLLRLRHESN
jgi:hypothetical protein